MVFFEIPFSASVLLANTTPKAPVTEESSDTSPSICPADLEAAIEAIVRRPEFARSRWGILIETLDATETLYQLDANKYFIPASNVKLLTTAAALLQLGGEFQIRTPVYGTGNSPNLRSLRVVGKGDPSLTTEQLEGLVRQLKEKGIEQISQLIIEDSYFKNPDLNSTWEWGDTAFYYATAVNSFMLNKNAVTLTLLPQKLGQPLQLEWSDPIAAKQWQIKNQAIAAPAESPYNVEVYGNLGEPSLDIRGELAIDAEPDIWGLSIVDPNQYFLESLRSILEKAGIKVDRTSVTYESQAIESEVELAAINSQSLANLIKETNRESNNLFAEALLKILETESKKQTALEAIQENLTKLGVNANSYILADGSGLSRQNLVAPEAFVETLQLMAKTPNGEIYQNSLAIAGVDGTLKSRFQNTPIQSNLRAKTGTLSGVSALSGYLEVPDYQPLVFSIIIEQSELPAPSLRDAIDEIVILLGRLQFC